MNSILRWLNKPKFPLKAQITQEIIDKAKLYDSVNCIGALTLKSVLHPSWHSKVEWGSLWGWIKQEGDNPTEIVTEEGVYMMQVREPQTVTFNKRKISSK